jgi:predicted DCC family thiol-disulfide oxidoreductase YuxK
MAKGQQPVEVFYDGECRLCVAARDWAENRDSECRLAFKDLNDPIAAGSIPVAPEQLRDEMWVRLPGGRLEKGFAGWLVVLRTLPRWRFVAWILGLPPLRLLGPPVYRLVARHRHMLERR